MIGTIYSIIPAVLMLVLVILTRNVTLSLGIGIVVGALFVHNFQILDSLMGIWKVFFEIFITEEGINIGNLYLITFLLLLGIMAAFLQASGGSKAFGEWMMKRVKTQRGSKLMAGILGIIIFIDDYFNSLAVGQIARPVTDRHNVSRAKLAYIVDSTSAPVTVISPISSWGAYIIGILGSIFIANGITDLQPLQAFVMMIPYNYYALAAIFLVFLTAYLKMDIGAMKKHETRAAETGQLLGPNQKKAPGDLSDQIETHQQGKVYHLLIPIIVLVAATVSSMLVTGALAAKEVTILTIFANTDVNLSLFIGGISAIITSLIFYLALNKPREDIGRIVAEGSKTMLPAIYILILAWMIGSIISTLETGSYLANAFSNASINPQLVPLLLFVTAGFMTLATGTSWATFGIMLPIAAELIIVIDSGLLLPSLAAVLAGSVFGDHCSPISDTTILSSTGAGSNHIDHVITQLPYAFMAAVAGIIGFLLIGFTNQTILSLLVALAVILIIGFVIHNFGKTEQ
ncbi:tetracycline efflux Na+/H+ antiporter family transporter Tet(35) [Compostibacillus humi]|uniref:Tetracycline efflux Na+/H+ antiporter family transporter Tet(35) n=1 Tax=Compostibacillus humi TaxID=1245525 RepID=A0A8J2TQH1_9BACI|nr:Na+/H+ antiporter NhaC family protein [Compostibacillus humi]GFZ81202.1 tetracycline efflux Na+/H+ antiporter family transporter Tet(35) [Compostibacillus humi]